MHEFHCIEWLPDHHVDNAVRLMGLCDELFVRLLLASTVIEDPSGMIPCTLQGRRIVRASNVCDGHFAVHITAPLHGAHDRLIAKTEVDSEIVSGVLDAMAEQGGRFCTDAWFEAIVRDIGVRHDQQVASVRISDGRHEVRINGLMGGWVLGGGSRWSSETSRGDSLGVSKTLGGAMRKIQTYWGFPEVTHVG